MTWVDAYEIIGVVFLNNLFLKKGDMMKRARKIALILSLAMLFCFDTKLLLPNDSVQSGEFLLNLQEKQYIQTYPGEKLAFIPCEITALLSAVFCRNLDMLVDPSFNHVNENLKDGLRIVRYSDMENVVNSLNEISLSDYKQQLKTGEALVDVIFDSNIVRGTCCRPKAASCKLVLSQLNALQVIQLLAALQGLQGSNGTQILQGLQGIPGLQGIQGIPGIQGIIGLQGIPGIAGIQGIPGLLGLQGIQGPQGTNGLNGVISSAQYVQLGSQPATVAAGQPFTFTTAVLTTPGITSSTGLFSPPFAASGTIFTLTNIGRYEINFQTNYPTPSGVVLYLGSTIPTMSPLPYTMIGKNVTDTGGQVSGSVIVETTTTNSFLAVCAAAGNSSAIGVPPNSSTTNQSATTVSFKQIQ